MENINNIVLGYGTEYYLNILNEAKSENGKGNSFVKYSNGINGHNGQSHNGNYLVANYNSGGGRRNNHYQISAKGLDIRAKHAEVKMKREKIIAKKGNFKIKKVKIPKWTYLNKDLINLKNNRFYKKQNTY